VQRSVWTTVWRNGPAFRVNERVRSARLRQASRLRDFWSGLSARIDSATPMSTSPGAFARTPVLFVRSTRAHLFREEQTITHAGAHIDRGASIALVVSPSEWKGRRCVVQSSAFQSFFARS
jgi:hypothetical protein